MGRIWVCRGFWVFILWLMIAPAWGVVQAEGDSRTIFGIVMEVDSGTPDVPVCLCDAATGLPLAKESYKPFEWGKEHPDGISSEMAIVVTDNKGQFRFENVPDGQYRLIAQKWSGPYKGVFEVQGTVIQLMGTATDVLVPRPADDHQTLVALTPLGDRIVQFDQKVGNNETFMFLSLSPPEFDPILGLSSLGTPFFQHLIGVNRMPNGKTTVIGVPNEPLFAFFFAADNSPGYATVEVPVSDNGFVRVAAEPFVAGWSDGRKTPPPKLVKLMDFLDAHSLTPDQLLEMPELSNATFAAYQARMEEIQKDLSRTIELADGITARVGDILAVIRYRRLQR